MASVLEEYRAEAERLAKKAQDEAKALADKFRSQLHGEADKIKDEIAKIEREAQEKTQPLRKQLSDILAEADRIDGKQPRTRRGRSGARATSRRVGPGPQGVKDYLSTNPGSTAREVAEALGVTPNSVSQNVKRMLDAGEITAEGGQRNRRYSVK